MVERTGGKGGFGAITSDNTDQRTGRYAPHLAVSRYHDYEANEVSVRCVMCGKAWTHAPNEARGSAPEECK